jgi:hypothetical protein
MIVIKQLSSSDKSPIGNYGDIAIADNNATCLNKNSTKSVNWKRQLTIILEPSKIRTFVLSKATLK